MVNAELPILDGHRGSVQLTTGPFYGLVQYYESYGQKYPPYLGMRVSPNDQGTFSKIRGDFVCIDGTKWVTWGITQKNVE